MWTAQFIAANGALSSPLVAGPIFPSWLALAAVASPLAEYALIRYVSGVPILEVYPSLSSPLLDGADELGIGFGR
jgi:steroid 5-alpha reductase family enzyme